MGRSEVTEGMRIIDNDLSLPPIPPADIMIYYRKRDLKDSTESLARYVRQSMN